MSEYDIERLYNIASSIRYAGDIYKKETAIKSILEPLGFRRFASGTNRIVYTYLEDTSFLVKVAIDKAGLRNSPAEFNNQMYLKPFVAKCFESHPSGVIASFERGMPITNVEEFVSVWDDAFETIISLIGEYIIEDIGTNFFMNWCIREGWGLMLCDYPEMFKLDGNKLFCNKPVIPGQKLPLCGGLIDFDLGFNYLVCTKCGKQYTARELSKAVEEKLIILKGEIEMDVQLVRGNEVIVDGRDYGTATIKPPKRRFGNELSASIGRATDPIEEVGEATSQILQAAQAAEQIQQPTDPNFANSEEDLMKQVMDIAVSNGDTSEEGMLRAVHELADRNVRRIEEMQKAEEEEKVEQPETPDSTESSVEESADLQASKHSGNRIKPAPPSLEQY